MEGLTSYMIAKRLTDDGTPTPGEKEKWRSSTIESILTNEIYRGSAILQKSFTADFLTKRKKKNEGEGKRQMSVEKEPALGRLRV